MGIVGVLFRCFDLLRGFNTENGTSVRLRASGSVKFGHQGGFREVR